MIKNLIVVALFASLCTALPTYRVNTLGNVLTKGMSKVRYLGSEIVFPRKPIDGNQVLLKFPHDPKEENYIIRGIKTVQNSVDSKIKIVDGGFGKNQITVAVTLPEHDVESVVSFFGDVVHEKKPAKSVLQAVKEFEHKKAQEESKSSLGVLEAVQMEYENYKKSQAQTNAQSKETESQQEESQEQEPEIESYDVPKVIKFWI